MKVRITCIFCDRKEPDYMPATNVDYVCSKCVQVFLSSNQDDLKRALSLAIEKGYTNKATALESFIEKEVEEVEQKRPKKSRRHNYRARTNRLIRHKERSAGRFAA